MLLTGRRLAELAPLYDLMCSAAWEGVTRNMAQDVGGTNRGDQLTARHWRRLADDACRTATATAVRAMPAGEHPMLFVFVGKIAERCRRILGALA